MGAGEESARFGSRSSRDEVMEKCILMVSQDLRFQCKVYGSEGVYFVLKSAVHGYLYLSLRRKPNAHAHFRILGIFK